MYLKVPVAPIAGLVNLELIAYTHSGFEFTVISMGATKLIAITLRIANNPTTRHAEEICSNVKVGLFVSTKNNGSVQRFLATVSNCSYACSISKRIQYISAAAKAGILPLHYLVADV